MTITGHVGLFNKRGYDREQGKTVSQDKETVSEGSGGQDERVVNINRGVVHHQKRAPTLVEGYSAGVLLPLRGCVRQD